MIINYPTNNILQCDFNGVWIPMEFIINSDWLICFLNEVYILWFYESKQTTI